MGGCDSEDVEVGGIEDVGGCGDVGDDVNESEDVGGGDEVGGCGDEDRGSNKPSISSSSTIPRWANISNSTQPVLGFRLNTASYGERPVENKTVTLNKYF